MSGDIALLTATAMVRRFRDGSLTPLEVMGAVFDRIDARSRKHATRDRSSLARRNLR